MAAFITALAVSALQTAVLNAVLKSALGGKAFKTAALVFAKVILYVAAVLPFAVFFKSQMNMLAIGFAVGFPVSTVVCVSVSLIKHKKVPHEKGDDIVGHGYDH